MKNILLLFIVVSFYSQVNAQVGINTTSPDPSSELDISSTDGGILIPRMTQANRNLIASPATGLMIYQTDNTSGFYYFDGSSWVIIGGGVDTQNTLDEAYDEGGAGLGRTITADNGAVLVQGNDGFQNTGTFGAGATLALSGSGTRMFFYPRKAAFRAGNVTATQWNDANIGDYSVAMGRSTIASGTYDTAIGFGSTASGTYSTALGWANTASGAYSFSLGQNSLASGWSSTVLGRISTASGSQSMVFGHGITASGDNSIAIGNNGTLSGWNSMTLGNDLVAPSGYEVAIGNFNTTYSPNSTTAIDNADRLFSVGNGTSNVTRSNALTIYKSGLMNINDAYNMPLVDGTAGQVMTTDGAGNLSFQNAGVDTDDQFLDVFSLTGTTLNLSLDGDGVPTQTLDLSPLQDGTGTDDQTIDTFNFNNTTNVLTLEIEDDGIAAQTVDLSSLSAKNTLDEAYDEGGPGAGRTINAENGAVTINRNTDAAGSALDISVNSTYTLSQRAAISTYNAYPGLQTYTNVYRTGGPPFGQGLLVTNESTSNINGDDGVVVEFTQTSTSNFGNDNRGFLYDVTYNGGSAANLYGFKAEIEGSGSAPKYGVHVGIPTSSGGLKYGIYSDVQNTTNGYAGYFIGRTSLGTGTTNRYLMPTADGTAGQVIVTDGAGQLSFTTPAFTDTQNTLDEAYDEGGAGLGRTINVDSGSLEFIGDGTPNYTGIVTNTNAKNGLQINTSGNLTTASTVSQGIEINNSVNTNATFTRNYGVFNKMTANGTAANGVSYGFRNWFLPAGSASGTQYGFYSDNQNIGGTFQYGFYNRMSNASPAYHFGYYSEIDVTDGQDKYGFYSTISTTSPGIHYGIYSNAQKVTGYAAYFIGRTSLGDSGANRYLMPGADGTAGQVMTTDGAGNVTFQDAASGNDADWYQEGTTNAPTNNTDDIFTEGNVGIGLSTVQYPLDISSSAAARTINLRNENNVSTSVTGIYNTINESAASTNGLTNGIYNSITKTNQSSISGVSNAFPSSVITNGFGYLFGYENSFGTSTSTNSYGLMNRFQGTTTTASGITNLIGGPMTTFYGVDNHWISGGSISGNFFGLSNVLTGSSAGTRYGVYTSFAETGIGNKYGEYITIDPAAGGTHFGVYANVQQTTGFAAYLIGRTSLGNATTNRYLMPGADGTAGQVMVTDGAGNLSWASAAGESTTASNGLTETGNDVQLGGTLTQATTIAQGNFGMTYNLTGTGDFLIQDNGADAFAVEDSGEVGIGTATPVARLDVRESGTATSTATRIIKTDNTNGITYGLYMEKNSGGTGVSRGINMEMLGAGTGAKYAFEVNFSGTGNALRQAFSSNFSGTYTGNRWGVNNLFDGSGSGTRFGIYNNFTSNVGGAAYGNYNIFNGSVGNYIGMLNSMTGATNSAAFGMDNNLSGSGSGSKTGMNNSFNGTTSNTTNPYVGMINTFLDAGGGPRKGMSNNFQNTGNGATTGIENLLTGTGNGNQFGVYNGITGSGSGTKYGTYNYISSSAGGTHYGTYNEVDATNGLFCW
ncbi:MAG: hypothetical protein R2786_00450 [Flavobacteriaceae bacterium]